MFENIGGDRRSSPQVDSAEKPLSGGGSLMDEKSKANEEKQGLNANDLALICARRLS